MSDDREQRIRDRAYALWEQEGGAHGRHDAHWQQAVDQIDAEKGGVPDAASSASAEPVVPPAARPAKTSKTGSAAKTVKPAPAKATAPAKASGKPPAGAKATATKASAKPALPTKRKSN